MRILSKPVDEILQMVKVLENEVKQTKHDIAKICWHMRGSIGLEEAYFLSSEDFEILSGIIKENLETTKKSGLPYF